MFNLSIIIPFAVWGKTFLHFCQTVILMFNASLLLFYAILSIFCYDDYSMPDFNFYFWPNVRLKRYGNFVKKKVAAIHFSSNWSNRFRRKILFSVSSSADDAADAFPSDVLRKMDRFIVNKKYLIIRNRLSYHWTSSPSLNLMLFKRSHY